MESSLAQALLTAVGLGLLGLIASTFFGLTAAESADMSRHISVGIFSTMVTLLAHSMMMFYLIGKGKAVKDALTEGGHGGAGNAHYRLYVNRISVARKPVFSIATLAMSVTIVAALLGAGADTGALPPIVHGMIAYAALACNAAAAKVEIDALTESSRVVDEVNRLLGS